MSERSAWLQTVSSRVVKVWMQWEGMATCLPIASLPIPLRLETRHSSTEHSRSLAKGHIVLSIALFRRW